MQWAICGHSERRTLCHESDESVAANVRHIMTSGQLNVILCVGETLADREAGHTMRTLQRQLEPVIRTLKEHGGGWERLVIAYEPVWAIGTGACARVYCRAWMVPQTYAAYTLPLALTHTHTPTHTPTHGGLNTVVDI